MELYYRFTDDENETIYSYKELQAAFDSFGEEEREIFNNNFEAWLKENLMLGLIEET